MSKTPERTQTIEPTEKADLTIKKKNVINPTTNKKTTNKKSKKVKVEVEVIEGPLTGLTMVITGESSNFTISRVRMAEILTGFPTN